MSDYENKGVLFKNDRKEKETQPDYTGKITLGGKEKRLAAWLKDGQRGKFMSLQVSDFQEQQAQPQAAPQPLLNDDFSDDIPF
tara:strand:+ start:917 stop:1165 length:249 start_codon:yes stop_codon:yes gene_type:complete